MDANFFTIFIGSACAFTLGLYIGITDTSEAEALCLEHWQVKTSIITSKGKIYCKVNTKPEVWQAIKESQVLAYKRSK